MQNLPSHTKARHYAMVIDLDKCTGCGSCMVACYSENNVSFRDEESVKLLSINWIQVYQITNGKPFPDTEVVYLPKPCQHCDGLDFGHPPCVSVCPAVATDYDTPTGIVSQIYPRCFGCRYCMAACPYHARKFNWWDPKWPADMEKFLNPDVSARMRGVVEKCTFCYHRFQRARQSAYHAGDPENIREQDYQTACTQACPSDAITFGDLLEPDHEVSRLVKSPHAFRLLEKLGTNPSVYYLSSRKWVHRITDNYLEDEEPEFVSKR